MPLYQVQDGDRPMWVVAKDWGDAVVQWKALIAAENKGETDEPDGIVHVADDDEIIVWGFCPLPMTRHADDQEFGVPTTPILDLMAKFNKGVAMQDGEGRKITAMRPSDNGEYLLVQLWDDDSEWFDIQVSEVVVLPF